MSPVRGQPRPGRRSSSASKPVGTTSVRAALRPRQMAGCSSNRASSESADMEKASVHDDFV